MDLQKMFSLTRQVLDRYRLIEPNDRIAVGISGGKDSMALLYTLAGLRRFYPVPFDLEAITVNLGFSGMDYRAIQQFCQDIRVPYTMVSTQIGPIVFEERKESNPCSLCAKMRRGALNQQAKALGCTKIAYAHHRDDYAETLLMSLFFEGRFYTFSPYTYIDGIDLAVIRPFFKVTEAGIRGFIRKYSIPVIQNVCPADHTTRREEIKRLLFQLNRQYPGLTDRILHAAEHGPIEDWVKMEERKRRPDTETL